jgi:hypothetical protein
MIGASMAVITSSPLFGWGVAFVTIAALAFAGRRNQKAGYKCERTNDVLDILMAWARADAEMRRPRQHPTSDLLNLAFAAGQQVPIKSPHPTSKVHTIDSIPISAAPTGASVPSVGAPVHM